MGDRERHLGRVGKGGCESWGKAGRAFRISVRGIVEQLLGEPEQPAAEDVQGAVCLRDREAASAKDAEYRVDVRQGGRAGSGPRRSAA